jgi:steroid 5-alpha-reductase/3-oxo-5-alpha-steroid 4-dehydrogenase 1
MEEVVVDSNFDEGLYPIALLGFFVMIVIMFIIVNYINAPYGRHVKRGWGFGVAVREAWIIMESPALFVMALIYHTGQFHLLHVPHVLLRLHQVHYIHRTLIFPFRMRADGKAMPVSVVAAGFLFNVYNSYLQARWISHYGSYPTSWLSSPQFLLGVTLFLGGFACNIWADNVLLNLRTDKEDRSYKIPRGFLYEYVTCPNYLSEVVEWLGWAIMTNSLAGFAFFLATLANLAPRAKGHHQWYYKKFSDYPKNRKALIPFIY